MMMSVTQLLRLLLHPAILFFFLFLSSITGQDGDFPRDRCYSENGTFLPDSPYASNVDFLLNSISTTPSVKLEYGFFNQSTGQLGSDYAEVLGLCHADLTADACQVCLDDSGRNISKLCANITVAVLYNENCLIRYSNETIYGKMAVNPSFTYAGVVDATDPSKHYQAALDLLCGLRNRTNSGGPLRKYGTDNRSLGSETIYGMVQCTPDLSDDECYECLTQIIEEVRGCCAGKIGGRVFAPSCQLRFETNDSFYHPILAYPPLTPPPAPVSSPSPPSPPPPPPPPPDKKKTTWIVISASVASAVLIGVVLLFLIKKRRKDWRQCPPVSIEETDEISMAESLQFDFSIIREATDDFSQDNKLGEGGFGPVFKGRLPNGRGIAVKRLKAESTQGETEFKNEVVLLARLQHRFLVRLLGFCLGQAQRLLIYELMPNSSLDKFIFDPLKRARLNWDSRYKIITGVVRGLVYLHEDSRLRIIHRDLKASNILLDEDMNPKISDFGMARLLELDQTQADTGRIAGTYGYMAPEYAMYGHFSVKSDVFSFGVLVLEILTGRRCQDVQSGSETLLNYVWKNWRDRTAASIVDPLIRLSSSKEVLRCIHVGLLCVQEEAISRPTMASVGVMLSSHSITLPMPSQPAFTGNTRIGDGSGNSAREDTDTWSASGSSPSRDARSMSSLNKVSVTDPYPR
ncbi:hypothetical protein MLD38_009995 [Melastoma candidum]|uniref:Uncharacterized protein n=1 Tax=Melastoma candidum TaxID=119954 RepID=A0ACB9QYK1_9MYRT|nr:hypothetical protein MLD38_009995 [Melastoma candidum]